MELARVIGQVVANIKDPSLKGLKLLICEPLDESLVPMGEPFVAVDPLQAGPGDIVYWITGREAALALPEPFAPVDAAIVGIVDKVDVKSKKEGEGGKEEDYEPFNKDL